MIKKKKQEEHYEPLVETNENSLEVNPEDVDSGEIDLETQYQETHDNGNGNGHNGNNTEVMEAIQLLMAQNRDLSERMDEIQEGNGNRDKDQAHLKMVNMTFDTPDKNIIELTDLTYPSIRKVAYAQTLDRLFDEDVQSGATSLTSIFLNIYMRGLRSKGGRHLARATKLALEQVQSTSEEDAEMARELGAMD